jgi:uncharacterized SAM-dependent methyltransferase
MTSEGTVEIVSVDDSFWEDGADLAICLQPHQSATVPAHVQATEDQSVNLRDLGFGIQVKRGESLIVDYSDKFHRPQFVSDVAERGFELEEQWIDAVWQ